MKTLEEKLGYTFRDPALLENALTHSSCANESRGKQPKILRETQGLGFAVAGPDRLRQPGGARREVLDKIAGDRLARADQPDHEQADGTGAAGRPLRQTGERKKQRREAFQPLSVFRDGLMETHAGLRWSSAQCAGWRRGCG